MKALSIVIPNYNGDALLEKNIPAVVKAAMYFAKQQKEKVEIIIVDDASSDQSISTIEALKKEFNKDVPIRLVQNKYNLGFSSTVNKGVKESTGDLIVLLNTDVRPTENFLIPLRKHFEDEKMFAVGCIEKSIEGSKVVLRGRGLSKWRKGLYIHSYGKPDDSSTAWVSGGSGMFRKTIWNQLGGMNELYNPFYWEDIDLSYRAQKVGYTVLFEKNSIVTHKHEEGAIQSSQKKHSVQKIAYRNQFIFIWTNITDPSLVVTHLVFLPVHLIKAMLRTDFVFISGFVHALLLLPKIFHKRGENTLMITRPDKSLQLFH